MRDNAVPAEAPLSARMRLAEQIRRLRKAAGISQARLAAMIGYSPQYVSLAERPGKGLASVAVVRAIDNALGAAGALLELHDQAERELHAVRRRSTGPSASAAELADKPAPPTDDQDPVVYRMPDHAGRPAGRSRVSPIGPWMTARLDLDEDHQAPWDLDGEDIVPVRSASGRIVFVSVSRRQFLHGLGAAASIGVIGDTSANPAAARSSLASLAPGADPVTHFRELRRVLIDSDNLFGPLRVAPAVCDQIAVIHQLRLSSRGEDYRTLTHVLAQYAEFAAWLAQDLGDYPAAESWLRRALEWSHIASDPDLIVFILARASQLAGDIADDPARASQLGEAAITMARPRSRLAAVAATYAAHGYALDGDPDQCARSYDRAHDLLADADDLDSAWAAWLDSSYIEVQRAHSQAMLGDYTTAATGFGSAIAALPTGYHRDRGVYLARQALAHAGSLDLEHAADLGLQALLIGTTTHSGRVLTELDRLNALLDQAPAAPSVGQFREALASVIVEQPV